MHKCDKLFNFMHNIVHFSWFRLSHGPAWLRSAAAEAPILLLRAVLISRGTVFL